MVVILGIGDWNLAIGLYMNLTRARTIVTQLYLNALKAVDPYSLTLNAVKRHGSFLHIGKYKTDISQYRNIYVIGAGKATAGMALALEKILNDDITEGLITVSYSSARNIRLKKIKLIEAGHPIPDKSSLLAGKKIIELLGKATRDDLIIFLISGGASAVMTMPFAGISLPDLRDTFKLLLLSGASIQEINRVRKHIDKTKGGRLAQYANGAAILTLVISDVIGNQLESVSSGPTVPDTSTFRDAHEILNKYGLPAKIPQSVRAVINKGLKGKIAETPKANNPCFRHSKAFLIGSNKTVVDSIAAGIRSLGYNYFIRPNPIVGEAKNSAVRYTQYISRKIHKTAKPFFFVSGGETTVTVLGKGRGIGRGRGGRNQEFALAFALEMEKLGVANYACLSCSTDGVDYIKEATGALVDGTSLAEARRLGLYPERLLDNNDSYRFHQSTNTLIATGPTGTNVNDVQIVAVW